MSEGRAVSHPQGEAPSPDDGPSTALPEVHFYFNVGQRLPYICRWVQHAHRTSVRLVVGGPGAALQVLDRALWDFDPLAFVPHLLIKAGAAWPAHARETPVLLLEDLQTEVLSERVCLNLGAHVPEGVHAYARVVEVVSQDPEDRAQARRRWRTYQGQGFPLVKHNTQSTPFRS